MSSSNSLSTRISAHLIDAAPVEGETVSLEGWLTFYDEKDKKWVPLRGKLNIFLNGVKIGECESDELGFFKFNFVAPTVGKHKVEVKFAGDEKFEGSYRSLNMQTLSVGEKKRVLRIAKIALIMIIFLIVICILTIYLTKIL